MSKLGIRLAFAWLVLVVSVHADSVYTLTLPSSISVPPGTVGSIQGTLTVLGPDPMYITGATMGFDPGLRCNCVDFGASLMALLGVQLNPGVYNFTFANVLGTYPLGLVTNITANLQLNLAPHMGKGMYSPDINVAFLVGSPAVGNDVTVRGTVVPVPEPDALFLIGIGLLPAFCFGRSRRVSQQGRHSRRAQEVHRPDRRDASCR